MAGFQQFPAVIDYSVSHPTAQMIHDAGYVGVMRYLNPGNRGITKPELDNLLALGLGVGFVYETTANRTLSGTSDGRLDAGIANELADSLGIPDDVPLVIDTIDFQASESQIRGPIADYGRATNTYGKRPSRGYGEYKAVEILCEQLGVFPCMWQCAAWSGIGEGSGGHGVDADGTHRPLSKYACLYQSVGYVLNNTSDHNSLHMDKTELLWHPNWKKPTVIPPNVKDNDMIIMTKDPRNTPNQYWLLLPNFTKRQVQDGDSVGFYRNDPGIEDWTGDIDMTKTPDRLIRRIDDSPLSPV